MEWYLSLPEFGRKNFGTIFLDTSHNAAISVYLNFTTKVGLDFYAFCDKYMCTQMVALKFSHLKR